MTSAQKDHVILGNPLFKDMTMKWVFLIRNQ